MRTGSVLVALAIMLVVLGTGVSYSAYDGSAQTVTQTTVQTYITTQLSVATTRSTVWLVKGQTIDLAAAGQLNCASYYYSTLNLTAGQVHVSYTTAGDSVSFWLLTQADYGRWKTMNGCDEQWAFKGVDQPFITKAGSADFTAQIPSSGKYPIIFMNADAYRAVKIVFNVDTGARDTVSTSTSVRTVVSTQLTTLTTESTQATTQTSASTTSVSTTARTTSSDSEDVQSWMDYRLLLGLGAIVVVAVVAVLLLMRRRKAAPPAPTGVTTQPAIKAASSAPAPAMSTKFCMHCGAKNPINSIYCQECGQQTQ
jgi:ribosomal protein L40E